MAKIVDSPDIARSRLRALRAEKPTSQMGQIRWAWPEVKAALEHGHSLTTVHQRLVHTIITGGQALADTLKGFAHIAETTTDQNIVVGERVLRTPSSMRASRQPS